MIKYILSVWPESQIFTDYLDSDDHDTQCFRSECSPDIFVPENLYAKFFSE